MLNKIFIMGRLTRDPELRRTQNGTAVTSFTMAVDRDFKNADGTKDTDFIDVVAWRNTAEFVSKYFGKDGNKRRNAEVLADNIYFGDSKKEGDSSGGYKAAGKAVDVEPEAGDFAEVEDDGDLPF